MIKKIALKLYKIFEKIREIANETDKKTPNDLFSITTPTNSTVTPTTSSTQGTTSSSV